MWGNVKDASPIKTIFWITSSKVSRFENTYKEASNIKKVRIVMGRDFNKKTLNPK